MFLNVTTRQEDNDPTSIVSRCHYPLNTETSGVLASHRHTCRHAMQSQVDPVDPVPASSSASREAETSAGNRPAARKVSQRALNADANYLSLFFLPRCSCAACDAPIRRGPARSSGEKASCRHPSGVDRAGTLQPGTPELPPSPHCCLLAPPGGKRAVCVAV